MVLHENHPEAFGRRTYVQNIHRTRPCDIVVDLTQSIWRKVQAEGLQSNYNNDEGLALKIRYLPALVFVAPLDV